MKNKIYFCIVWVLCAFLSCTQTQEDSSAVKSDKTYLSIVEAKEFFENQVIQLPESRSEQPDQNPRGLTMGDFTPKWDIAETSHASNVAGVDVPVLPKYSYQAIISTTTDDGRIRSTVVAVTQKLIVVKDQNTEALALYVMSIIPDLEYYRVNKGDLSGKFRNYGDKGGFSGVTIYTDLSEAFPVSVVRYKHGRRVSQTSIWDGYKNVGEYRVRVEEMLCGMALLRRSNMMTRNGEWDVDGGPIPDVVITPEYPDPDPEWPDWPDPTPPDPEWPVDPTPPDPDPILPPPIDGGEEGGIPPATDNLKTIQDVNKSLLGRITNPQIKQYISTRSISFTKHPFIDTFRAAYKTVNGVVILQGIEYSLDYFNKLTDQGKLLVLYHEYLHGYLGSNGKPFDHNAFVNDPIYMRGIKDIFPGRDDAFYNLMRFAGCSDATEFRNFSLDEQIRITRFINTHIKK